MDIKLLGDGYENSEELYLDFLNGTVDETKSYFSNETITYEEKSDFPIYIHKMNEKLKREKFKEAVQVLIHDYIDSDRNIHFNKKFWHSYLVLLKRDYILKECPQVRDSHKEFKNIVLKKFDWENYIYKCVLAAEYIHDAGYRDDEQEKMINIIYDNLDLYNYLIKTTIFRSSTFILNFLRIIDNNNLSTGMKKQLKYEGNKKDERVSRKVIEALNNSYPIVMSPLLSYHDLEEEVLRLYQIYKER